MEINPITKMDFPDPDVIRVGDTYYMVSTTMHFMPGCEILRSYDLIHWEFASYVYETLDGTEDQKLEGTKNAYGKGMWAASIRYHKNTFYICFVANDTGKTYLYKSQNIEGPWEKHNIEGFYHDCSLLFDDDRVYIVYGNKQIHLTELESDLSKPKINGLNRIIVSDEGNNLLGYEGSHIYKINNKYYVFFIHSDSKQWKRIEACFSSDSLEGQFTGGDVLNDDMGYHNQGVAQGGIVDAPNGEWYAILFQDRGAVGRIPVLVPVNWENDFPVFGLNGKVPNEIITKSTRPDYQYKPLICNDDFKYLQDGSGKYHLKNAWQWNHEPDDKLWSVDGEKGVLRIQSGKLSENLCQAVNTLTQRMMFPKCEAYVTINGDMLKEGDYAGICAFQGCYGMIAMTLSNGQYYLTMEAKEADNSSMNVMPQEISKAKEFDRVPIKDSQITLKIEADFTDMKDEAQFYYKENNEWKQLGITHKLYFKLDHFTGCRFGLFLYSTREIGGIAQFSQFVYNS